MCAFSNFKNFKFNKKKTKRETESHNASMSKRLVDVYLCRHGTTTWNLKGLWQGLKDTRLAKEGIEQARNEALSFSKSKINVDVVVSSPLLRAKETASILSEGLGVKKDRTIFDDRLKECYLGEFEGMQRDVIYGPKYKHIFDRLRSLSHKDRIRTTYFEDLETPKEISDRVVSCILDSSRSSINCAMFVSHSVILKSVLASVFDKRYEGISMRTLSWMHMKLDVEKKALSLVKVEGIEFDD